jgi:Na+/melibiose symporter-like transporter
MNLYRKIAFLMGQVGLMMLARYFFQWITKFCTESAESLRQTAAQVHQATSAEVTTEVLDPISRICGVTTSETIQATLFSVGLVGAILMLFRIFDGVTDPLAGGLSDWWVRQGRQRRSLLWYSFWIAPVGLILCFAPTYEMNVTLRWTFLVGGMFIFFVGYTLYCIPYWSLISDYAGDNERDQQVLSTLLGAGILIATGLGFVISPFLIKSFGYGQSAWCFALVAAPLMVLPYFAAPASMSDTSTSVSDDADADMSSEDNDTSSNLALMTSLKRTFNNNRFLSLMFLFAGSQMSLTIMTAAAPFIAEGLLGESKDAVPLLMGPFLGMTLLSFPLVPWISRRVGWERAMMWASIGLSSVYLLTGTLGSAWLGTPLTTAMIIFAAAGPFVGVLLGLEGEAITHCAQDDGPEYVSIYWGVFNLIVKSLNGLALWMSAMIAARICPLREGFWGQGFLGDESWIGVSAVRSMGMSAGILLLIGVLGYLWAKRSRRTV